MLFGVWYNPFSWGQDILDSVISVIYGILLTIDCIIYSFISYIYQIFLTLASGSSGLIDDYFIGNLVQRIYTIIGVVMLFLVAYSLLKAMINVDDLTKGKKSPINIIKDVLISIGLIAFVPTIFNFAFQFQNALLKNNTIGKIIVGNHNGEEKAQDTIRMGGYEMAKDVYGAFMHADVGKCNSKADEDDGGCEKIYIDDDEETTFGDLWVEAEETTTFWALSRVGPKILSGEVRYYLLIAPVAGILVLFVLISYCIDMALRLVKLSVYEVIAPLPIFARILPNEQAKKVFSNWIKATVSTFIEVFIRIAILYFAVFVIANVVGSIDNLFTSSFNDPTARLDIVLFSKALIVIGIIMFVKQAPNIIKEITGLDGGKYNVLKSAKQGFSLIAGGIAGRSPLAAMRAYNQAGEAKLTDFSAVGNQYKRRKAIKEAKDLQTQAGMSTGERLRTNLINSTRKRFGYGTLKEQADKNFEKFKNLEGKTMSAKNDSGSEVKVYSVDSNGNIVSEVIKVKNQNGNSINLDNGVSFELTNANINALNEAKAKNDLAKSEISEQVNKLKGVVDANSKIIKFKKGKYFMKDSNHQNLVLTYKDANGRDITYGANGATQKQLESWLEANRERMSADEYARESAKLTQSINDWSVSDFVSKNGQTDPNDPTTANKDIIAKKREFVQQYKEGNIYKIDANGKIEVDHQLDQLILNPQNLTNPEGIQWDLISSTKSYAEDLNREINVSISGEQIKQGTIDSSSQAIDSILNQGKQQVEVEKNRPTYKAYEASDKARNITEQGGKK